jgi:hypothetical protein
MRKKPISYSKFSILRVLIGLFVFVAGASLAVFATANQSGLGRGTFSRTKELHRNQTTGPQALNLTPICSPTKISCRW